VIAVATVIEEEEEDLDQTADDPEAPNTSEPDPQS
jgi:hypothetical protein